MKTKRILHAAAMAIAAISAAQAQVPAGNAVPVTVDNFLRAESDLYLGNILKNSDGIGKLLHDCELAPISGSPNR